MLLITDSLVDDQETPSGRPEGLWWSPLFHDQERHPPTQRDSDELMTKKHHKLTQRDSDEVP